MKEIDWADVAARFREKWIPNRRTGCWLWTAAVDGCGYGLLFAGRPRRAHRISWYLRHKRWPVEGKELDHLCRNRWCVNPDHLEEVTHQENVRRGRVGQFNKNKTHCAQGHEFNEANTYVTKSGYRSCRRCSRAWHRAWKQRKRAQRVAS